MSDWTVWLVADTGSDSAAAAEEAAERIIRSCQERSVPIQLLAIELATGKPQRLDGPGGAIVIAPIPPTGDSLSARMVVVSSSLAPPPARTLRTAVTGQAPSELALQVIALLETSGLLPSQEREAYTPDEEEELRRALGDLGYL